MMTEIEWKKYCIRLLESKGQDASREKMKLNQLIQQERLDDKPQQVTPDIKYDAPKHLSRLRFF